MRLNPLLPNLERTITKKMLEYIGVESIDDLFTDVPHDLILKRPLRIPSVKSEYEIEREIGGLLARNNQNPSRCFIGGGIYSHYIPSVVDELASRSEFMTSYTQYQPEVSQGMLQALFEYQSLICDLTGMDVANSSMYDWATAVGEASRMAMRVNGRKRILTFRNIGPERLEVMRTYCDPLDARIDVIDYNDSGRIDFSSLKDSIDTDVSAVYVENPNFFGLLEEQIDDLASIIHEKDALLIMGTDPISLGLIKPPGEYGADIVVGEGQSLGLHMSFGGPSFGIFAAKGEKSIIRQMPGRIIGLTTSRDGNRRGYSMIMQTREQHIRRENATSNICTNQALSALTACIYLSLLGGDGLRDLSTSIISKSHYTTKLLSGIDGLGLRFRHPFFREFTLRVENPEQDVNKILQEMSREGIHVGPWLGQWYDELRDSFLLAVSEIHLKDDLNCLHETLERRIK